MINQSLVLSLSLKTQEQEDKQLYLKVDKKLGMVAHTCNPSYLVGRVREDHGLRPTWANSSQDFISTNG
jgi:hypothetical protein